MGRLFWKFFFSYWAALLIAVVGTTMTGLALRLTASRGRKFPHRETAPPEFTGVVRRRRRCVTGGA